MVDLTAVRSVPECVLTPDVQTQLPDIVAAAPWKVHARGLFWWSKPDARAVAALRDVLPAALGADLVPVSVVGALISYDDTPVGPYHEVIGIVSARRGVRVVTHVPFIAVDSAASVVGGRANWALPKTLVDFAGEPSNGTTMSAYTDDWRISATPRASRMRMPFASPPIASLTQVLGDERWVLRGSGRGSVRFARLDVEVESTGSLAHWLPSGACRGVLCPSMYGRMGPAKVL